MVEAQPAVRKGKRGRPPSRASRQRILDAALRLFAEQGYSETSVADVQAASGMSRGSGALYKHFSSKEELLEAGLERALQHMEGVLLAQRIVGDLGNFRAELEILGRFLLIELGEERDFLRILLKDADRFPKVLEGAWERLIDPAYHLFAGWLSARVATRDPDATAAVALGAILQYRAMEATLGAPPAGMDEERFLQAWVELVMGVATEES